MNRDLIEQFAAGADAPQRAIAGLTREQLLARPVPDTWSLQEIVIHPLDSDLVATDRMKRIIAESNPLLVDYDQDAFAARLHYLAQDAARAAEVFRLNRLLMADILRRLPDDAFARIGVHSRRGKVTLGQLVQDYIRHAQHHLQHLHEKRELATAGRA